MKKIRSSQPAIPVMNWVKHQSFPVSSVKRFQRRKREKNKKRSRRFWIRPLFADRATIGASQSLVLKKKETDRQNFGGFARMSPNWFDHLLELTNPMIMKKMQLEHPYHHMNVKQSH